MSDDIEIMNVSFKMDKGVYFKSDICAILIIDDVLRNLPKNEISSVMTFINAKYSSEPPTETNEGNE